MKGLKHKLIFLIILIASSTAFSQTTGTGKITGLSTEQKREIVATLQDYPLVKEELNRVTELLMASNTRVALLQSTITEHENKEAALELKYKITQKQLDIKEQQLKNAGNSTGEKITYFTGGVTAGALLLLLFKIL